MTKGPFVPDRAPYTADRGDLPRSGPDGHRVRVTRWEDPTASLADAAQRTGLGWLEAIAAGELPDPPMARLMGMTPALVEKGRVVFTAEPGEHLYNPIGTVHGGFAATLLDSAMGCAVHSTLPAGTGYTTLELTVRFIRAITADTGALYAEGRAVHAGGRTATADGRLTDERDRLYAHASTTCLLLSDNAGG